MTDDDDDDDDDDTVALLVRWRHAKFSITNWFYTNKTIKFIYHDEQLHYLLE
jgi:hypothetical protein